MLPHFNPQNPNNQPHLNGITPLAPQQVMANPGSFGPNPMQFQPQFQMGMLNNPHLAMLPFTNPNAYFAPATLFPFPQGSLMNFNANNLPQLLGNNALTPPHFLPNGHLAVPNLMQNLNQIPQMQMPNHGPQNPSLLANAHLVLGNNNGVRQQSVHGNSLNQINPISRMAEDFRSAQVRGDQITVSPGAAKSQGNAAPINRTEKFWRNPGKSYNGNPKRDASQRGVFKQQFHSKQNNRKNFNFDNSNLARGGEKFGANNFNSDSHKPNQVRQKRSLALNYTVQEIQQWREERRKNYPSMANMEKKLKENPTQPELSNSAVKTRKQQLKEILAKQAELGCEVAEIPSCYLSDSEQQADAVGVNKSVLAKRGRFQNKFDKRGKFNRYDRFSKRQKHVNHESENLQNERDHVANKQRLESGSTTDNPRMGNKKNTSLLKKLLNSEIKRDKLWLLQAFKFIVINSFFKNCPEEPLKFPEVIVRESGDEAEITEDKATILKGTVSDTIGRTTEKFLSDDSGQSGNPDGGSDNESELSNKDAATCRGDDLTKRKDQKSQEEEGEITD